MTYTRGLSKSFKKVCNSLGIKVHFKISHTIHTLLMAAKEKYTISQKSGVIYQYKCTQAGCEEEYTRETGRTFGDRLKKHLRGQSPIYQHNQAMGHPTDVDCFSIIDREAHNITVTVLKINSVVYIDNWWLMTSCCIIYVLFLLQSICTAVQSDNRCSSMWCWHVDN